MDQGTKTDNGVESQGGAPQMTRTGGVFVARTGSPTTRSFPATVVRTQADGRRRGSVGNSIALWMLVLTMMAGVGLLVADRAGYSIDFGGASDVRDAPDGERSLLVREATERGPLGSEELHRIAVFERVSPAVVQVTTLTERRSSPFTRNVTEVPSGTGSGFVYDEQGHIITNYHVIENAARNGDRLEVTTAAGTIHEARVVGFDPSNDIAVLQIDPEELDLTPLEIGSSADLKVGQSVLAIGNPFRLDQTLTTGIISALDRTISGQNGRRIEGVIQTDASINPGNSGGPLLDSNGRLIGMNTAILSPSGTSAGIGFAVPVDTMQRVIEEISRYGTVSRAVLGVEVFSPSQAARLGVRGGVLIAEVKEGSGAEQAGLQGTRVENRQVILGDIIVAIGGTRMREVNDLREALEDKEPGDTVSVTVQREDGPVEVEVPLSSSR